MKRLIPFLVLLVCIAAVVGIIYYVGSRPESISSSSSRADTIATNDWVDGNKDAKTILVEYSDFQCPACGAYYPLAKQIVKDLGSDIAFVYRHFPLSQHKNAKLAAQASEAAGNQGKFWEMHAMIFEHQKDWSENDNARDIFLKYAETLGLDRTRFEADLDSAMIAQKIDESYATGVSLRINGTPTFFLDGKKLDTPRSYEEFKQTIQDAIAAKK